MKTLTQLEKEEQEQFLKNQIDDFKSAFCPFGSMDIKFAVREAISAGYDGDWAFEQCEEFADSCGIKITDVDPCYCIMQSILQEARNEIIDLADFDVQNDASFDVHGNYCASSWDYKEDDQKLLSTVLKEKEVVFDDLSEATQYWLTENEIEF